MRPGNNIYLDYYIKVCNRIEECIPQNVFNGRIHKYLNENPEIKRIIKELEEELEKLWNKDYKTFKETCVEWGKTVKAVYENLAEERTENGQT